MKARVDMSKSRSKSNQGMFPELKMENLRDFAFSLPKLELFSKGEKLAKPLEDEQPERQERLVLQRSDTSSLLRFYFHKDFWKSQVLFFQLHNHALK